MFKLRLQRITTSSRWIPEIDGLRFLAIGSVLLTHILDQMVSRPGTGFLRELHPQFIDAIGRLGRGVQLFFIISGFILAQPFLRQHLRGGARVGLRSYFLRRLTRLEPPYLLSLLIYGIVLVLHGMSARTAWASGLASAAYIHHFFRALPWLNFPTWSLEVEVQFYLIVPWLTHVFRVQPAALRRGVLAVAVLALSRPWFQTVAGNTGLWLLLGLPYFLLGFLLADFGLQERARWRHGLWDVVALLVWPCFFFLPDAHFFSAPLVLLAGVAFAASLLGPWWRRGLAWRPVALIGGMCYSLYLLHMLLISAGSALTRHLLLPGDHLYANYAIQLALLLPPIVLVGGVYFVLVERPCMDPDWPRKFAAAVGGRRGRDPGKAA